MMYSEVTYSCTKESELRLPAHSVHEILPVDFPQYCPLLPSTKQSCLLHPLLKCNFNFLLCHKRTFLHAYAKLAFSHNESMTYFIESYLSIPNTNYTYDTLHAENLLASFNCYTFD